MKRFIFKYVWTILAALVVLRPPGAVAERIGGPMSTTATAPAYESVFFNIPFQEGRPAVVSIFGNGQTILHVLMYDADGHMALGNGSWDRKTVGMDVYRTGVFRIEVRNLGQLPNTFVIATN